MSNAIVIHGFETSNNLKVRVALGFKKIPHEFCTIEPSDRAEITRISGQHLTPVMTHGETTLFDSAAILRYLDANFPDTPRLFGRSREEQWEIENWELFARSSLAGPMMQVIHARLKGEEVSDEERQQCAEDFSDCLTMLTAKLQDSDWLVGDALSAADITAAAVVFRVKQSGVLPFPETAQALLPWVDSVMAHDEGPGGG